jgi:hypothetical protein
MFQEAIPKWNFKTLLWYLFLPNNNPGQTQLQPSQACSGICDMLSNFVLNFYKLLKFKSVVPHVQIGGPIHRSNLSERISSSADRKRNRTYKKPTVVTFGVSRKTQFCMIMYTCN